MALIPIALAATAAALPGAAFAATTCAYKGASDRLEVRMSKGGDDAFVSENAGAIRVEKDFGVVDVVCSGVQPTVTNTDRIAIDDTTTNANTVVQIEDPAGLAPGATEAGGDAGAGSDEIEIDVDLGRGGNDRLTLIGDGGADYFDLGTEGINPNASGGMTLEPLPDADIFPSGVDVTGGALAGGNDVLDAAGNAVVGGDYRGDLAISGSDGDDEITGGTGDDELEGHEDEDDIDGGKGDDRLDGGADHDTFGLNRGVEAQSGDDLIVGGTGGDFLRDGPGVDTLSYADHADSVEVDFLGGPVSGNASDNFDDEISVGIENLIGTDDPDDGDTLLTTTSADSVIDGGAGPDDIDGGNGSDTVTYASRDEDVQVTLGSSLSIQGGESDNDAGISDEFTSIEKVVGGAGKDDLRINGIPTAVPGTLNGGPGNDLITGGSLGDVLAGGMGRDELRGLDGIDLLKARDRRKDKLIDCGDGANSQEKAKFDAGVDPAPISC